jgi:hypothetical protein
VSRLDSKLSFALRAKRHPIPTDNPWRVFGLYEFLRSTAAALYPNDFELAFRQLCAFAGDIVRRKKFERWASGLGHEDDAKALRVLGRMDVDDFFRRHPVRPPDNGGDELAPPPLFTPIVGQRVVGQRQLRLVDA